MTGPGGNYGWNVKEGSFCFDDSGFAFDPEGGLCPGDDGSRIDPIAEYDTHLDGHSVMGGFVYRGAAIPDLVGHYVFGDFSKVFVFTFNDGVIKVSASPGRLFYLVRRQQRHRRVQRRFADRRGARLRSGPGRGALCPRQRLRPADRRQRHDLEAHRLQERRRPAVSVTLRSDDRKRRLNFRAAVSIYSASAREAKPITPGGIRWDNITTHLWDILPRGLLTCPRDRPNGQCRTANLRTPSGLA